MLDLRSVRERKGLSLARISADTKIPQSLLEALERRDLRKFPPGIYARAYARSYADAVGLSADEVLATLTDGLPAEESLQQIAQATSKSSRSAKRSFGGRRPARVTLVLLTAAICLWAFGPRLSTAIANHREKQSKPYAHAIAPPAVEAQAPELPPLAEPEIELPRRPAAAKRSSVTSAPPMTVESTTESDLSVAAPETELLVGRTLVTPLVTDVPAQNDGDLSASTPEQPKAGVGRAVKTFGRGLRKAVLRR